MANSITVSKAVTLLLISLFIVIGGVVFIKAPTVIVLITGGAATIALSLLWGTKWKELENNLLDTLRMLMIPILILLAVGMLIGSWVMSGTLPLLMSYGLSLLNPTIFLLVVALCCTLMSIMTGTSWGTIGTLGIVFMGIAVGFGIPIPYAAGAIIVGAFFGDKMSPLSDSVITSSAFTGVDIVEHIKHMLYTTIPGYIISLALFLFLGLRMTGSTYQSSNVEQIISTLESNFNLNPILLLPPIVVLFLLLKRAPTLPALGVGVFFGCVLAAVFQNIGLSDMANILRDGFTIQTDIKVVNEMLSQGGLSSMLGTASIMIGAAIFSSPLMTAGVFQLIMDKFVSLIKDAKVMMTTSLLLNLFFVILTGTYAAAYALFGPLFAPLYEKYGLHRKNLSRTLEDTGTAFAPVVPWGMTAVFIEGTLHIKPFDYILYAPMIYTGIIFALIYIFTGYGIAKLDTIQNKKEGNKEDF